MLLAMLVAMLARPASTCMPTSTDHRRATAERNAVAILDAAERLLTRAEPLTMVAVATESGLSRPTVYAHFKSVGEIVEAAAERTVVASTAAFAAARPDEGPAGEALARMVAASWHRSPVRKGSCGGRASTCPRARGTARTAR